MAGQILDLFCGAGGFAAGFQAVGFKIVAAVDQSYNAFLTYHHNFPEALLFNEDIHELHAIDIYDRMGISPDVIIASPPCEAYTSANTYRQKEPLKRLYDDERGRLVLDAIRIIGDLRPKLFLVENVPELLSGELKWALRREFKQVDYEQIYFNMLFAEDYGTPSKRKRLFISNIKIAPKKQRNGSTVQEVLNLPSPTSFHDIPNHEWCSISPKKLKKIGKLKPGNALVFYQSATRKTYTNWVRLVPNKIAPTVIGHSRFIHPFEDRVLTVRENARLMGFSDQHLFFGGLESQYDQVGEAVPVPLAITIAKYCQKHINMV
ncbi:MAG: DNA cytosine methyltransferase [Candidatus Helarchaeota archaeon]|nr:DNA cytosine methyltransferase [Candidatus Helarchaeota archaeon]